MIKANKEKCIKCYKCIKVCPVAVLGKGEDGVPEPMEGRSCMSCMHCASTCPVNAITYDDEEAVYEPVTKLPETFADDLKTHMMQRRSYRHFADRAVDEQTLKEVLDAARWSPSAKNQHPAKYIVVNSKDKMKEIMDVILDYVRETGTSKEVVSQYESGTNLVMGEARTLLLAYADDNAINAVGDTYIAMANIESMLQSRGIGTCWGGYLTRFSNWIEKLHEILGLPEGHSFYAAFMLGYPGAHVCRCSVLPARAAPWLLISTPC